MIIVLLSLMGELVETRRQRKPESAPDEFIVTAPYADVILSVRYYLRDSICFRRRRSALLFNRYRTELSASLDNMDQETASAIEWNKCAGISLDRTANAKRLVESFFLSRLDNELSFLMFMHVSRSTWKFCVGSSRGGADIVRHRNLGAPRKSSALN